mmetsp:Transcript_48778/g.115931  ORF Transcript_48778/g.115931 Transcript_48778/m.115931 type:complete len:297 (+) Transcript_48778:159-1049(+)
MVGGSSQSAGSSGPARRGFEDKRKAVNSKDYEKPLPDVEHWREDPLHEVGSPRSPHKRGVDVFQRGVSPASPGGFSRAATPVDADHHAEHASIPMDFMDRALHSLFAVAARCGMMNCVRGMLPCLGYAVPSAAERLQRKWYRVHPITDELYFVRPDYGMAGRVAGPDAGEVHGETGAGPDDGTAPVRSAVKDNAFRAVKSMGVDSMRRVGLGDPAMDDSFVNMCKLCYDNKVEVVVLPCKHGGMCEACLRRSLYSRPLHRGGRACPLCRRPIKEVVRLYYGAAIPQYGYGITAGQF